MALVNRVDELINYVARYGVKGNNALAKKTKPQQKKKYSRSARKYDDKLDIPSDYLPGMVEKSWDKKWESAGLYKPEQNSKKQPFVMMIPPPNVTGSLHLGHALMCAVEDAIVRYWRMKGRNCLWLPGTDHAGIATQSVVERMLMKHENLTRHDLGREKFLERVWVWKEKYGGNICNQLRRLGSSVDWSREVFTMDSKLSKAVTEAYVRMFDKGLIYRSNRLCHWSCALRSAISDAEVDPMEFEQPKSIDVPGYTKKIKFGIIHKFGYKVVGTDDQLIVATTRLETMLGDTAVAVHPEDARYKHLHGKFCVHPFQERKLPIICDPILVDMTFGTGVVKVTPAHDHNDFECGKRNKLDFVDILDDDGLITEEGGKFAGMKRYDARYAIMKELKEIGQFHGEQPNKMSIGVCSKSGDIIEPRMKPQWYVDCTDMAKRATDAVRNGELKIGPDKWGERTFFDYLDNIRPWCISRQLWWGHRIPAYYIEREGKDELEAIETESWVAGRTEEEAMKRAKKKFPGEKIKLHQDPDVLDTWFSSGLFPFSTLGWPDKTDDLRDFFPGHLLETGGDIIFFWVARMVMMSLELMGKLPFDEVFLHAMVRDKNGAKMSKSKGNVINPLHVIDGVELKVLIDELYVGNIPEKNITKYKKMKSSEFPKGIEECGADALRFGLLAYVLEGGNINLDVARVAGYRKFCQKLWQITRFTLLKFQEGAEPFVPFGPEKFVSIKPITIADRWILSRLSWAIAEVETVNPTYIFGRTCQALHSFVVHEYKKVYLELTKPFFTCEPTPEVIIRQKRSQDILYMILDILLKLLHPLIPFVTEELYQQLPGRSKGEYIMVQPYPSLRPEWRDLEAEEDMEAIETLVHSCLSSKEDLGMLNKDRPGALIVPFGAPELAPKLESWKLELKTLGNVGSVDIVKSLDDPLLKNCCPVATDERFKIFFSVSEEGVDIKALLRKKKKQLANREKYLLKLQAKASNPKVPPKIQAETEEKAEDVKREIKEINDILAVLAS